MKRSMSIVRTVCYLAVLASCPTFSAAQTIAKPDCFWSADASTWKTLGLDARQVRAMDSLRLRYPDAVGLAAPDTAPSGDRILARGAEEDARIQQGTDALGRVRPSVVAPGNDAGAITPAGERADGQPAAPTSGGNTSSVIRTPAEVQERFNTNTADEPKHVSGVPQTARPVPPPYPSRSLPADTLRPNANAVERSIDRTAGMQPDVERRNDRSTVVQRDVDGAMRSMLTPAQWKDWERWCTGQALER